MAFMSEKTFLSDTKRTQNSALPVSLSSVVKKNTGDKIGRPYGGVKL